jgi:dTDP-glucose 4,6-dehydratase
VTGGAGFIGSNFIRYWLAAHTQDSIVNLDALTYAGDRRSLSDVERAHADRYEFIQGDILDRSLLDTVLTGHAPDAIVHFAAESHNSRAALDPSLFVRTNIAGTQTLLEAARQARIQRFHHISTCEVYGDLPLHGRTAFTEEAPYRPRTPYNASKAAADLFVRAYHETFGLDTVISNSSNNYGPWQHPEKVIPLFTTNALDDRPLPLYRHSSNRREWVHVEDHCRALELVLLRGKVGETYNVGSGDERSIEEIADAILDLLGKPRTLKRYVQDRPGHDRRYLLDHSKIERELGWRPRILFADGLREAVTWYQTNRAWWEPKKEAAVDEFAWSRTA